MRSDWLPGKRTDQLAMANDWVRLFRQNGQKWNIPTDVEREFETLTEQAQDALYFASSADTRTPVTTAKCKAAFDELIPEMRDIKDRYFKLPPLTDPDIISLGLKPRDTTKTPVAVPTAQATADITYPGPSLLMLHMKPLEGTTIDRRANHGYRIYFGVFPHGGASTEEATGPRRYLTKIAVTGEDLPHSQFTRRQKEMLVFPPNDSGKTAYFCIRFENSKGQAGPWGPVFSAIIP
jgi:hypothetical protein